ncbi:MAG: hypothetical protein L6R39_001396 [Caloplaca ligustica]|nr:MAG: hypothetical protein L6R39_001396 [Caloplaca ligustica]
MRYREPLRCFWKQPAAKPAAASFDHRLRSSYLFCCAASSSSSKRWQTRQGRDRFAISAKVEGLKSRAAYKLLEINEKYKIFKPGQTVVDLGYAPGSWSQVAVDRTSPNGLVVGIDVIPAQPPTGVSTIQGNFLSPAVQEEVKKFLRGARQGRHGRPSSFSAEADDGSWSEEELEANAQGYLEQGKQSIGLGPESLGEFSSSSSSSLAAGKKGNASSSSRSSSSEDRMVDVVLSDMSAPWEQTEGFWKRSLSDPYYRMMNTSGINFRDHAGSMDLCDAALRFAFDTLRPSGHLVCKYYQGAEDKALETRLKALFAKVHRGKPESSRSVCLVLHNSGDCNADDGKESKEAYFVALRRKAGTQREEVFG